MVDIFEQRAKLRSSGNPSPKGKDIFEQRASLRKPEKSPIEKDIRVGAQYGLGAVDKILLPLTLQAELLNNEDVQKAELRKNTFEDLERLAEQKSTGVWDEKDEKLFQLLQEQIKNPELMNEFGKKTDVRPSGLIKKGIKQITGYDLEPEGGLEEFANFMGSFSPKDIKTAITKGPEFIKGVLKKTKDKFSSGLTKPRAVESKLDAYAAMGKKTQKKAIEKLNKEAGSIAKEKIHAHMPITKQIEEGADFGSHFNKNFSELEKSASRSQVSLDLTPVSDFFQKTASKYRGIPSPHADAIKIKANVKATQNKMPNTLNKGLKTYRSNNKKLDDIYEKSRTEGKQKEYADYLISQNKALAESFRLTLGKDHAWVKQFDRTNSGFRMYKKAQGTLRDLDKFFAGKLTPSSLEKLGNDINVQKKLALSMGDAKAKEIAGLAKDLKSATDSIKSIPKAQFQKMEAAYPLSYFIPVFGKIAGAASVANIGIKISRNLLGSYLSKPAYTRAYGDVLKAIKNQDVESYKKYAAALLHMIKEDEED